LSYLPGNAGNRVVDSVAFKGQENGWSLGHYPDGGVYWHALSTLTRGASNAAPPVHVVITEIMYHPPDVAGVDDSTNEFVELFNPSGSPVNLYGPDGTWRLDGGVSFSFPSNVVLAPLGYAAIVNFSPADTVRSNNFCSHYGVSGVRLFGPYSGKLANNTDRVAI